MIEQQRCDIKSFDSASEILAKMPISSRMISDGDATVYGKLDPLSEDAFNYRDSIEIENHVSGIEIVKRLVPKTGTILYLASSYGPAPSLLVEEGYNMVSLDADRSALQFAKNYIDKQVQADAEKLPFRQETFVAVVSRDFLAKDYHSLSTSQQDGIMNEVRRVLKSGGQAIFYTLYTLETEEEDEKPIREGLPEIPRLLSKFGKVVEVSIRFSDRPEKNTVVYVVSK